MPVLLQAAHNQLRKQSGCLSHPGMTKDCLDEAQFCMLEAFGPQLREAVHSSLFLPGGGKI